MHLVDLYEDFVARLEKVTDQVDCLLGQTTTEGVGIHQSIDDFSKLTIVLLDHLVLPVQLETPLLLVEGRSILYSQTDTS